MVILVVKGDIKLSKYDMHADMVIFRDAIITDSHSDYNIDQTSELNADLISNRNKQKNILGNELNSITCIFVVLNLRTGHKEVKTRFTLNLSFCIILA